MSGAKPALDEMAEAHRVIGNADGSHEPGLTVAERFTRLWNKTVKSRGELFDKWREATATIYALSYPEVDADLLEHVAGDIDCGGGCENLSPMDWETGTRDCALDETTGCAFSKAESLRALAKAIRHRAEVTAHPLDVAYRAIDALGGTFDPADQRAAGYDEALGLALAAIEKLGGRPRFGSEGEAVDRAVASC